MTPAAPSTPPAIADYALLRLIGRGSYGDVWLAHGVTGLYRAIKVVWRARFADAQPYEREFKGLREFARVSLEESRQLALLHVGRGEDFFYYVMELADDAATGREVEPARYVPHTLRETLARRGRLPATEVLALAIDLARALAGLHTRGLVHRDIKPSNVIFVGGVPKLADIGLVATASAELTFVGTEGYVPPEGPGAPSADVFSLGKLLYELSTGLDRKDYPRLPADFHTFTDRKALLELNEVLIRACELDATRRHKDASVLLEELLLLQAGRSVRKLRNTERRLARALRMAAALGVAACVAAIGAWGEHRRAATAEAERDEITRKTVYSANLARTQRALEHSDYSRARQLLSEDIPSAGAPDLRGFEWQALWHAAKGDPCRVFREKGPAIDRIALSPDESLLAVHDISSVVTLYDATDGREIRRIVGVAQFAGFSSDGSWVVGSDTATALTRWVTKDGRPLVSSARGKLRPLGARGENEMIAFEEGPTDALVVWDFANDREIQRVNLVAPNAGPPWILFRHVAVSPAGDFVTWAAVSGNGSSATYRVTLASLGSKPELWHLELQSIRPSTVGIDREGPWAVADVTGQVWRFRNQTWEEITEKLPVGTRKYAETEVAGTSSRIAAQGRNLVWINPPGGRALFAQGHGALLSDLLVSRRSGTVYSAALDGGLRVWSLNDFGARAKTFRGWDFKAGAAGIVFSEDGRQLCLPLTGEASVTLDAASLTPKWETAGIIFPAALTTRGLLGVGSRTDLHFVDPATGTVRSTLSTAERRPRLATANADGNQVAVIDHGGDLLSVAADRGPVTIRSSFQRNILIALNRVGDRLWTTATNRELLCLSWPEGRVVWRETLPAIAPHLLLLPDQRHLIVALETGNLEVRDAGTGVLLRTIGSESAAPQSLAATPDGKRLFAAGIEGDIHCFDPATWNYLHSLPLHTTERLHVLVCSPDGKTLAALTKTGTLHVLRTE